LPVVSHDSLFTYTFPDVNVPTTYLVRLTVEAENGCTDTSSPSGHYITIYPSAKAKIKPLCYDNSLYLKAIPLRHTFFEHRWSWIDADGTPQTATGDSIQIHHAGTYSLFSISDDYCFYYDTFQVTSFDGNLKLYTIEGQITHNGNPLSKVAVLVNDTNYTFTNAMGEYYVIADSNASVNLTPYLLGYRFSPQSILCSNVSNNLYNQDFTAEIPVTGIQLSPKQLTLYVGNSYTPVKASVIPSNAENKNIRETNTNYAVAYLLNSTVHAVSAGTTLLVFTTEDGSFSDTCEITVKAAIPVAGVSLNTKVLTILEGKSATLIANILPPNATNQNTYWQSLNNAIATVSNNGTVTAVTVGTTYIVVTTDNGGFKDTCQVFVTGVGIPQWTMDDGQLRIYPNPTNGQLKITNYELREDAMIEIYDVMGQKLLSIESLQSTETTIDVTHLEKGLYFLKFGNQVVRFVKE